MMYLLCLRYSPVFQSKKTRSPQHSTHKIQNTVCSLAIAVGTSHCSTGEHARYQSQFQIRYCIRSKLWRKTRNRYSLRFRRISANQVNRVRSPTCKRLYWCSNSGLCTRHASSAVRASLALPVRCARRLCLNADARILIMFGLSFISTTKKWINKYRISKITKSRFMLIYLEFD